MATKKNSDGNSRKRRKEGHIAESYASHSEYLDKLSAAQAEDAAWLDSSESTAGAGLRHLDDDAISRLYDKTFCSRRFSAKPSPFVKGSFVGLIAGISLGIAFVHISRKR